MVELRIRHVKKEIRILGVDDARFTRGVDKWTRVVGVIHRGGDWVEGILQIPILVDGDDVTDQLAKMVLESGHYKQLRVIMTRDTIFGGVNVLDLLTLTKKTKLPVIAVSDSKPDMKRVEEAMKTYSPNHWQRKCEILKQNGPILEVESRKGKAAVYLQWSGLPFDQVKKIVQQTTKRSRIPEPLRLAHLFASSFVHNP